MSDPGKADDQALVALVQRGRADALDQLVDRYHTPLSLYCERMLGDPETAREVTQETFLRMIRALPRYRPQAKFSTWLYTIATNLARDELRRRHHREQRLEPLEEADTQPLADPPRAVADRALDQVERDDIRRALAALSPSHREVIVLHFYEGFSYQDIAGVCGVTIGTVGSRIHYAVKHLRRHLASGEENPS